MELLQISMERLQKVLARAGIGSRRSCEQLIARGKVTVNGAVAILGQSVEPKDRIAVEGKLVDIAPEHKVYYLLNKPRGVVSTVHDEHGRRTVLDLVPATERVYPVGRLDADSEGLILLTNDGELAYHLTHPRYEVPKTYLVWVRGEVLPDAVAKLRRGVQLEDGLAKATSARVLESQAAYTLLEITLKEGKKREIRRMCEAIGHEATRLRRVAIGPLRLGKLTSGMWRPLSLPEITTIRRYVGLDKGKVKDGV